MSDHDDGRRADHDSPWKMALESYFQEFLDLLFPAINEHVDWSQGYQTARKASPNRAVIQARTATRCPVDFVPYP